MRRGNEPRNRTWWRAGGVLTLLLALLLCLWLDGDGRSARRAAAVAPSSASSSAFAPEASSAPLTPRPSSVPRGAGLPGGVREVASSAGGGRRSRFEKLLVTPDETRLRFTAGDWRVVEEELEPGVSRSRVELADAWQGQERGCPSLPRCRVDVAVARQRTWRVELLSSDWEEIRCAPPRASLGLLTRDEAVDYTERTDIYGGSAVWPAEPLARHGVYRIRDVAGCGVSLMAAAYDFGRGVLRLCRSAEFRIVTEGAEAEDYGVLDAEWDFRHVQTRTLLTSELLGEASPDTVLGRMLLIVPDGWQSAVERLVAWRRRQGFAVTVLGYPSETGEGAEGVATTIAGLYASPGLTHLVLAGRADDVPPAILKTQEGLATRDNPGVTLMCSDVPYALLAGDDLYQDVFLSRLPAASPEELERLAGRLVDYESRTYGRQQDDDEWRATAVFVASAQKYSTGPADVVGSNDRAISIQEAQRLAEVFPTERQHYDASDKTSTTVATSAVAGSLDAGAAWVQYLGHGKNDRWVTGNYAVGDACALANGQRLPFVGSYACLTANFGASSPSLGEAMLLAPSGGASGFLGATNESRILPPVMMMRRLNDAILEADGGSRLLGQGAYALAAIQAGVAYCESVTDADAAYAGLTAKQHHLLGDAALAARLRPLRALVATASRTQDADGGVTVSVQVTDGAGGAWPAGAAVSVVTAAGDLAGSTRLEAGGAARLSLPSSVAAEALTVTVSDPLHGWQEMTLEARTDQASEEAARQDCQRLLGNLESVSSDSTRQWLLSSWAGKGASAPEPTEPPTSEPSEALARPVPSAEAFDCRTNPQGVDGSPDGEDTLDAASLTSRLEALWLGHGDLCRPEYVGESMEGRQLVGVRLGTPVSSSDGRPLPELLVVGGLHGDETAGMEVALCLAEWLLANRSDWQVRNLLASCCLYVLPCANPDGLVAGTRENALNADLERAFPTASGLAGAGAPLGLADESSGRRWPTALTPEASGLMRWCAERRLTAALVLHSGGARVLYPYGDTTDQPPDEALLRELAQDYAAAAGLEARGAAEAGLVGGESSDWLYRALGALPLVVDVAAQKRVSPERLATVFETQRPALLGWLERCASSCVAVQVRDDDGNPLAGARVSLDEGQPMATDAAGLVARVSLDAPSVLSVDAPGHVSRLVTGLATGFQVLRLAATDEAPVRPTRGQERHLPGRVCVLTLTSSATGFHGVQVRLPQGWRLEGMPSGGTLRVWRHEQDGTLTLVCDGAGDCALPLMPPDAPDEEHLLTIQTLTARQVGAARRLHWLSAEPMGQSLPIAAPALASLSAHPRGALELSDVWRWDGAEHRFVLGLTETSQAGDGLWLLEAPGSRGRLRGWYPFERRLRLGRGWNLVGVPWRLPASVLGGTAFGVEERVLTPVSELRPGVGYWVFSTEAREVSY
ncbi:MAG: C25 family cysteine peptidase [Oligosphaeraceae bacterium]